MTIPTQLRVINYERDQSIIPLLLLPREETNINIAFALTPVKQYSGKTGPCPGAHLGLLWPVSRDASHVLETGDSGWHNSGQSQLLNDFPSLKQRKYDSQQEKCQYHHYQILVLNQSRANAA